MPVPLSRRRFIAATLGTTAVAAVGCTASDDDRATATEPVATPGADYLEFRGEHQRGITHPGNAQGLIAAFTVTADDRAELQELLDGLTGEIEHLMSGQAYDDRDPAFPPLYTGTVGNPPPPADLSIVVSVGASLFDERYGLADRKPVELEQMPFLANDRLDPERSHGDQLVSVASANQDVDLFALRQLMRVT